MKRWTWKWLLPLGITVAGLLFSGCRASPVLEQVIYTQEDAPEDKDNDTKINDNREDHENKDEDLTAKAEDQTSNTQRDRQETAPRQGESADTSAAAPNVRQEDNSVHTDPAAGGAPAQGPQPGESGGQSAGEAQGGAPSPQPGGDDPTPSDGPETPNPQPTGALRQVVDVYGNLVDIPEDVNTVTAVGSSGEIVLMLGGGGRLLGASESLTENPMAQTVFANRGIASVSTWWDGDGSGGITDSAFQALLAARPDVCFAVSGAFAFTEAQLAQMQEAGIHCVTLPRCNTPGNLKKAVEIVGAVLGDKSADGGTNAPELAKQYVQWYDGILASVNSRTARFNYNNIDFSQDRYALRQDSYMETQTDSGLYTLYLSAWDQNAVFRVFSDSYVTLEGTGVGIAPSGYSTTPFGYYMSVGGVVNTAAAANDMFRLRHWYVSPLDASTRIIQITGSAGETDFNQSMTKIRDTASGSDVYLGEDRFPAVVVETNAVKAALEADAAARKLWTNYGPVTSSDGKVHGFGFLDEIGQIVSTAIRGNYSVYVVPRGVSSWSAGGPEGVMASMWTAAKFYNAFTDAELISELQHFYRTFYGYDLTQAEALQVLAGA